MALVTRQVSNVGAPLYGPGAVLLANVKITFSLINADDLLTTMWDAISNEMVIGTAEVTTNSNGEFTIPLWPNDRGTTQTEYLVHIDYEGSEDFVASLRSGTGTLSWSDFLTNGRPLTPAESSALVASLTTTLNTHVNNASVHITPAESAVLATISGINTGDAPLAILDASTQITANASSINFVGGTMSHIGGAVTIELIGGAGSGDVVGPNSSISGNIPIFASGSGKILSDSGFSTSSFASLSHNHNGVYEPASINIQAHIASTSNPHNVTKSQIGLSNVDNTSDLNKPISTATSTALSGKVNTTLQINGHSLTDNFSISKGDVGLGSVPNLDTSTTANIADSLNKRFITDALYTVLNNTSGVNSGDQTNISGNAGTVTNGVYTTGSYANPGWITSLAGSKITGSVASATNASSTPWSGVTGTPTTVAGYNILDAATLSFVDAEIAAKQPWVNHVEIVNLLGEAGSPPVSPTLRDAYIITTGGNIGAWSGFFAGDVVQWQGASWVKIITGAIGLRFGVAFVGTPTIAWAGFKNQIATINGGTPGAWTFFYDFPNDNATVLVDNINAYLFGSVFTYEMNLDIWNNVSKPVLAGIGLLYSGNYLNLANTSITPATPYNNITFDAQGRAISGSLVPFPVTSVFGRAGNVIANQYDYNVTDILAPVVGTGATDLGDMISDIASAGYISGGDPTILGGGNFSILGGEAFLRAGNDSGLPLKYCFFPTLASANCPSGETREIYVFYNGGSPIIQVSTTLPPNYNEYAYIGDVHNLTEELLFHIAPRGAGDVLNRITTWAEKLIGTKVISGENVSDPTPSSRYLEISGGDLFDRFFSEYTTPTINTSATKSITGITNASRAQVTCVAHGLSGRENIKFSSVSGMTQINGFDAFVELIPGDPDHFLVDIDTTAFGTYTSGGTINFIFDHYYRSACAFTGSISGTTLTVSAVSSGQLSNFQTILGAGITANTVILSQLTGTTGQTGTYSISNSQTVGSEAMTISGWAIVDGITQWDNANYDNGSGIPVAITGGNYGNHWVLRGITGAVYIVYGQAQYASAVLAKAATPPINLPDEMVEHGFWISQIVFLAGATSYDSIVSIKPTMAAGVNSGGGGVTVHNDLSGIQGGISGQRYHVTAAQNAAIGILPGAIGTSLQILRVNSAGTSTEWTTLISSDVGGLGTIATQNSNSVSITGGSISGASITGYTPTTTTVNGHALSANVTVTKGDVGLGNVANLDTSTSANITESTNKRFVTDAMVVVLGNTSGTNTGDETNATLKSKLGAATSGNDGYLTQTDWSTFNNKQSALGFTPYNATNPAGYISGNQSITLSGNVTGTGTTSITTTIANKAITLAKMDDMLSQYFLGRNTTGLGAPEYLSAATVKTILSLNNVENTALSTWAGSSSITTVGTLGSLTVTATISGSVSGSAATLTTSRSIYGNSFNGSADLTQVIASTYGGTGNGFTKFSGPTTAEKTFTLPDSNATLLYNAGPLGTPASGNLTNCTFPTLNQNTTGTAAGLSTALIATSGGTGQTTSATGDMLVGGTSANTWDKLSSVAVGSVLISNGIGSKPSWSSTPTFAGTNITGTGASFTSGHVTGLTFGSGKTLTVNNSVTILSSIGDGTSLDIAGGGTLGTNAFTSTTFVPTSTTVNGHALSANVTVTKGDVGLGNVANLDTSTAANITDSVDKRFVTDASLGYTTTATAAGTTTLTVSSNLLQYFTGTTTQTVVTPDSTTLALGRSFLINNNSTGLVTINKNGGSLLVAVPANTVALITVTDISSAAGVWDNELRANLNIGNTWTKTQSPNTTVLTSSGGTTAISLDGGNFYTAALTENTTLGAPTSVPPAGTTFTIDLTQHASAAKTWAFNTAWKPKGGLAGVMSTTLGAVNTMTCTVRSDGNIGYGFENYGVT